ncbi:thiol-disulfide oxidoreductase DCC family protein [Zooshikella ganghwensis]|uniref:DUF393 domain-containing protein n=1 Tax=Zooshikella ganghwensis TaxID=202772 RepID=A0A4P9VL80_9GAMM|nr:DUF393 domain-containing protein [Zooshikella ganghwensis]RDH43536.1 DUF393 domain-containing protein [Zooshikella ganghwensis]
MGQSIPLTLFYDGACPFCMREIAWLRQHNDKKFLSFVDISEASFNANDYGLNNDEVNKVLHAQWASGETLRGMEVTRAVYNLIGLGWLVNFTGWPVFNCVFDKLYMSFAKRRILLGSIFSASTNKSCSINEKKHE